MRFKVVIVDLPIPPPLKKWGLRLGVPLAAVAGGGAIAYAAGLVTWSNGQTLNASDLNANFAYLQDQLTGQAASIRSLQQQPTHAPSAFQALLTTPTPIASGALTPVVFNTVSFDLGSEYDPRMGRFSPKQAGVYLLQCGAYFPGAPGTLYNAGVYKNGVEVVGFDTQASTAGQTIDPVASGILQLAVGDVLTCSVFQLTGATQILGNIRTDRDFFSAARLY